MKKKLYITDAEHKKCQKVASIFSSLEEDDIIILDVGAYGFVVLLYYTPPLGFEALKTFTDSHKMFDFLWEEWLNSQLIVLVETMYLGDLDYEDVFEYLPEEKQTELMSKRELFLKKADLNNF
ncbi:MAG: hypothetical protein K2K74_05315 [Lachnospiraceae bacterium]|nr:hypothetical protein [Lachnospiraceae bacterium]